MKINSSFYWKKTLIGIIVCTSFLLTTEVCTSDESGDVAVREAREARDAAEQRAVQLELELEQSRKALAKMRSRYADLFLRSHGLLKSLRQTELQVANLWHNKDDSSLESLSGQLLEVLEAAGSRQLDAVKALDRYEESLNTLLQVLQPSEAMQKELKERLDSLRNAIENGLKPLAMVAGKGGSSSVRTGCRVLDSDEELQMVLLDGGSAGGMVPESRWALFSDGKVIAKFVVVDVRLELSAAVLLEGVLTDVPAGSVLLPLRDQR